MRELPLKGIRALDFCNVWHGPHLNQWLAVMGAEVIKVETMLRLDSTRKGFIPGKGQAPVNQSADFLVLNYSKKSISLNMIQPKAVELVKKLVKITDIVSDNFGGPVMERWGLGYEELKKIKSDIIVFSGSGYGRYGPRQESPAYAAIIEAFNGLTYLNGYFQGEPKRMGSVGWTDMLSAQQGVFAILTALYYRSKTGKGQYIDLSMTEAALTFLPEAVMDYTINKRVRERWGNRDDIMAPHGCYPCKGEDHWVTIAISNQKEWKALCKIMGNPEWTTREDFSDELNRWKNQAELDKLVGEWTKNYDHHEAMAMLQKVGIIAGATLDVQEVLNDPHMKERGFFVDMNHPELGKITLAGLPYRLSDTPKGYYESPPLLGGDNQYVFGDLLGLSKEDIKKLEEEQVIV
ncbi:MAG: CoA transferase [Dehalococcoidales bacterium]|nr:CoA transferase [Dehalococcoidales bacterium]